MFNMKKVTAGKDALGEFAPLFARLNDDVLFGEVWSREEALSPKIRSILTVAALTVEGVFDSSVEFHMRKAKENGVSGAEIAEILTHLAFYAGWPKAWAAFRLAKNIWTEKESGAEALAARSLFPIGKPNMAYEKYFKGRSYTEILSGGDLQVVNVTFEPACRNNWHIHKAEKGGGQLLLCVSGRGWYREWGGEARPLSAGDTVEISAGVKHWHGAARDSWFSHIAVEKPGQGCSTEWLEPVSDEEYFKLG